MPGSPNAQPGWYPTGPNEQRYWDGAAWTDHTAPLTFAGPPQGAPPQGTGPDMAMSAAPAGMSATTGDTSMAMLSHLLMLFAGFLAPLVIYVVKRDDDPFTRFHAAQALNFQITMVIAWIATIILLFLIVGFFLIPVLLVAQFVMPIIAAVKANKGEWYRYPLTLDLVK